MKYKNMLRMHAYTDSHIYLCTDVAVCMNRYLCLAVCFDFALGE